MTMKIKSLNEVNYTDEDRTVKVDFYGEWHEVTGAVVKIQGYKFLFAPVPYSNKQVAVNAYSLDSLKLFDRQLIDIKTAFSFDNRDTFCLKTMPLAANIAIQLDSLKGGPKSAKKIFKQERKYAELECNKGAEEQ